MHVLPTGMISVFSCKSLCKFQVIDPKTGKMLADAPSLAGTRAAFLAVECEWAICCRFIWWVRASAGLPFFRSSKPNLTADGAPSVNCLVPPPPPTTSPEPCSTGPPFRRH